MIVRSTATTTYEKSYVSVFCKVWLWWIIKQKSIKPRCPLNLLAEFFNQVVVLALLLCFQMGYVSWVWCVPHQQAWTCERHGQTCQKPSGQSKLYSVNQNKVKKTKQTNLNLFDIILGLDWTQRPRICRPILAYCRYISICAYVGGWVTRHGRKEMPNSLIEKQCGHCIVCPQESTDKFMFNCKMFH